MTATQTVTSETRDVARSVRRCEADSELTRVLDGIDPAQVSWLEQPRPRPRPVWFRESADERAVGKIRRALDLYDMRRIDTHLMVRILSAAHADWERAEDAWIAALRTGAPLTEVGRLQRLELDGWDHFCLAEELLDLCLRDQSSAGRRLFDALHACRSAWDAVRALLVRVLSDEHTAGAGRGAEKGGAA